MTTGTDAALDAASIPSSSQRARGPLSSCGIARHVDHGLWDIAAAGLEEKLHPRQLRFYPAPERRAFQTDGFLLHTDRGPITANVAGGGSRAKGSTRAPRSPASRRGARLRRHCACPTPSWWDRSVLIRHHALDVDDARPRWGRRCACARHGRASVGERRPPENLVPGRIRAKNHGRALCREKNNFFFRCERKPPAEGYALAARLLAPPI